jgi:hypothetical protein
LNIVKTGFWRFAGSDIPISLTGRQFRSDH